jgi:hypothetical protein
MGPAAALFPAARRFARPGLEKKRPDLAGCEPLTEVPDPLWVGTLEHVSIGGMPKLEEVALFHRPARTLLLFDLCFHLTAASPGMDHTLTRWLMRMNGAFDRFGPSRIARSLMRDRAQVREAVARLRALAPRRIVVAHGAPVEEDADRALESAFAFA